MTTRTTHLLLEGCRSKLKSGTLTFRHAHSQVSPAVELFEIEREQQLSAQRRIQKIKVNFIDVPGCDGIELQVNKHISTPYSCAKHISEYHKNHSCLSLVNGMPWSIHRPLVQDCNLTFLNFQKDDPTIINQAYWRSCSFILGSVLTRAIKPECKLLLHRPPDFSVESGSFAYDFSGEFGRDDWRPTSRELLILSQMGAKLSYGIKGKPNFYFISPLDVSVDIARQVFSDNRDKLNQLDELSADQGEPTVTVYKMGSHVDMLNVGGPLVSNANTVGRFNVTAIHKIGEEGSRSIYRAQGVSLPSTLTAHFWTYDHLLKNATPLNTSEELKKEEAEKEEAEADSVAG